MQTHTAGRILFTMYHMAQIHIFNMQIWIQRNYYYCVNFPEFPEIQLEESWHLMSLQPELFASHFLSGNPEPHQLAPWVFMTQRCCQSGDSLACFKWSWSWIPNLKKSFCFGMFTVWNIKCHGEFVKSFPIRIYNVVLLKCFIWGPDAIWVQLTGNVLYWRVSLKWCKIRFWVTLNISSICRVKDYIQRYRWKVARKSVLLHFIHSNKGVTDRDGWIPLRAIRATVCLASVYRHARTNPCSQRCTSAQPHVHNHTHTERYTHHTHTPAHTPGLLHVWTHSLRVDGASAGLS